MVRTNLHRLFKWLVSFSSCFEKAPDPEWALLVFGARVALGRAHSLR